mmetsp:Transcript_81782/g.236306  ORF Transcript_81782/g.236306 Transcript_81782/m.236306 type:complete len:209 (+) Transcript_81782:50-676(+)
MRRPSMPHSSPRERYPCAFSSANIAFARGSPSAAISSNRWRASSSLAFASPTSRFNTSAACSSPAAAAPLSSAAASAGRSSSSRSNPRLRCAATSPPAEPMRRNFSADTTSFVTPWAPVARMLPQSAAAMACRASAGSSASRRTCANIDSVSGAASPAEAASLAEAGCSARAFFNRHFLVTSSSLPGHAASPRSQASSCTCSAAPAAS